MNTQSIHFISNKHSKVFQKMYLLTMGDEHQGTINNIFAFVSYYFECVIKFPANTFPYLFSLIIFLNSLLLGSKEISMLCTWICSTRPIYRIIFMRRRFWSFIQHSPILCRLQIYPCFSRNVQTRDTHISPSVRWMYRHTRGYAHVVESTYRM